MRDPTLGVYVHVPFCQRICPYCDFTVVGARRLGAEREGRYVEALLAELALRRAPFAGRRLETLYLGGGTPSLLRPASIERIARSVRSAFPDGELGEVTLEVNPSSLLRERLPGFRDAGVTRLSVGIQSFDDRVLKRLGRAHRAAEGRAALAAAREAGFADLSADLIFAAPGQQVAGFERDLAELLAFAPEHASCYELTIEAGTPFALAARRGQLALAGEDECLRMMDAAERRCAEAGLLRYEISSFARPGHESRHNRRYWERRPVLGLGVGAWSLEPAEASAPYGARRANVRDLESYLERVLGGAPAAAGPPERLDAATARGEAVFLALRTARGLDAGAFEAEFGAPPRGFFGPEIAELVAQGLLDEARDGGLRLTPRGGRLADAVAARFVAGVSYRT